MTIEKQVEREIAELHIFFEQWFRAELPPTDEAFARFDDVLAPDFNIITPEGQLIERQPLVDALRSAHGSSADVPGGLAISTRHAHVRVRCEQCVLATYEEWQRRGDTPHRGRLSSVLFTHSDAPNGLVWRHVHETWLPEV